jgi:cytochrome c-type biogenesis protein CcmH
MRALLAAVLLLFAGAALPQADEVAHPDPQVERRLKSLADELRCLVCQNQTIADSNAPLAVDLRNQIRTQIGQGRGDDEIRAYMVERYGDFVLYRPPFKATTAVLWVAPFALLLLGAAILFAIVRRRHAAAGKNEVPEEERARIEALLSGEPAPRKARKG